MIYFIFPFTYKGKQYNAGCEVMTGKRKQFHVIPKDDLLKSLFGYPIKIIENEPNLLNYGSTPIDNPDSSVLAHCLADGLISFRRQNPQY